MGVTKSDFVRGLQCPKMLWLDSHKPEERVIPPEVQARLDQGNEFGDGAMGMFGEYEEMTSYKPDGRLDYTAMIKRTAACIEAGTAVICEAAFSWYGNYCAADILRKMQDGYRMYEVKNTSAVRKEFLIDIAFQRFLAEKCGVKIAECYLVLHGDESAGEPMYKIVDVTAQVKVVSRTVERNIFPFGKLKRKDAEEPRVAVGEQCDKPYECWYKGYCSRCAEGNNGM